VDNIFLYCPGVNIPSTLKAISNDQLVKLNRLHTNRKNSSRPFTITVAEGNENLCLDENGCLTVIETPDQVAANAVIELIEDIGKVWYEDRYKVKIDAAQAAFDALTEEQKVLVSNDQKLWDAIERYNALKAKSEQAAADKAAADQVILLINAIGTVEYTDASKAKIDAAQAAYDALTEAQKELVSNVQKLNDAIARYNELKAAAEQAAADRAAADAVIQKINAIGTVEYTDASKAKIDAARNAYNALTETQKGLVSNARTLTDAVNRYNELKAAAEAAATPSGPDTPQETNLCKWCGKSHSGFGGSIVGFFHNVLWFFKNLFR
jgi:DNA repair exonuclease SbcCD ATPase subunit